MMQGGAIADQFLALIVNHDPLHVRNTMLVIGCARSALKIERRGAL